MAARSQVFVMLICWLSSTHLYHPRPNPIIAHLNFCNSLWLPTPLQCPSKATKTSKRESGPSLRWLRPLVKTARPCRGLTAKLEVLTKPGAGATWSPIPASSPAPAPPCLPSRRDELLEAPPTHPAHRCLRAFAHALCCLNHPAFLQGFTFWLLLVQTPGASLPSLVTLSDSQSHPCFIFISAPSFL